MTRVDVARPSTRGRGRQSDVAANPDLDRESVRGILHETADKIGWGYDTSGHSHAFGYGRVNAQRAVEAAANGKRALRRRS